jgi:RimJ/RimL family protein N-acetyltransferase
MIELSPDNFDAAADIVRELSFKPNVGAALQGTCPARIFVDNEDDPHSCLIWEDKGLYYLAGSPENHRFVQALAELFGETRAKLERHGRTPTRGLPLGYVTYHPAKWENELCEVFPGVKTTPRRRRLSRLNPEPEAVDRDFPSELPSGYRLHAVDRLLFEASLENTDSIMDEIKANWNSLEDFFSLGYGACVVQGARIVSWCLAEYPSGNRRGIGVETLREHRQLGLAGAAVSALIHEAANRGWELYWDSWEDNTASNALAEKSGFTEPLHYRVQCLHST